MPDQVSALPQDSVVRAQLRPDVMTKVLVNSLHEAEPNRHVTMNRDRPIVFTERVHVTAVDDVGA